MFYIKTITALAVAGMLFTACEKEASDSPISDNFNEATKINSSNTTKSGVDNDVLSVSLTSLGNYLNAQDINTNGALISYLIENPDYSLNDLHNLGLVDELIIQTELDIINDAVSEKTDQEILTILDYVSNNTGFYSTQNQILDEGVLGIDGYVGLNPTNVDRFRIFYWQGLLSPGPNCLYTLFGNIGNGC
jgi:hypothetical protein